MSSSRGTSPRGPRAVRLRRREDAPPLPEVRVDRRLVFESEPVARWVGDWWGLRMIALMLVRRKRRAGAERVALPWNMILLASLIWIAIALGIIVAALLFEILKTTHNAM